MTGFDDSGGEPWQEAPSGFGHIFALSTTANMTLSPSLLVNGRELGSSERIISHCPLCPVKMSREFCMAKKSNLKCDFDFNI